MKDQALMEIRRRVETATESTQRVKLIVLEKAIETGLMIEPVGQVVDVTGDVFRYAFGLLRAGTEIVGDPLAYIAVAPIVDDGRELFSRYAERANQAFKVDEHEKETCLKLIYAYLGVGGGQQPGEHL